MRALVISGGASKLPFGLGVATELNKKNSYDFYLGISAGAIISLFLAAGKSKELYEKLLNIKIKDVFSVSPVNKKGKVSWGGIWRLFLGKNSLGNNKVFINTLKSILSEEEYNKIDKEIIAGVTNFNLSRMEYPSSKSSSYEDFIQWIYASSNIPIATSPVKIGDCWYCDGGVLHYVGIEEAIRQGATEIDVILHSPMDFVPDQIDMQWEPKNLLKVMERTLQIMRRLVSIEDILIAGILSESKGIKINFYFPEKNLTGQTYNLDENLMKTWYSYGIEVANLPAKILTT